MCHELCAMSHMLYAISMSAQSHYQVVVRQSGAVIYGPDSALVRALQTVLAAHTLEPLWLDSRASTSDELARYSLEHDLDYGFFVEPLPPSLDPALLTCEYKILLSFGYPSKSLPLPPGYRRLYLGEFLSGDLEGSPTVRSLLQAAATRTFPLTGDGLSRRSLATPDSLAESIFKAALSRSWEGELVLCAPPTFSDLSLVDLIRQTLSYKTSLEFVEAGETAALPWDSWESRLNDLGILVQCATSPDVLEVLRAQPAPSTAPLLPPVKSPEPAPALPRDQSDSEPARPPLQPVTRGSSPSLMAASSAPSRARQILTRLTTPRPQELEFVPLAPRPRSKPAKASRRLSLPRVRVSRVLIQGVGIALALYIGTLGFAGTILGLSVRSQIQALESGRYASLSASGILPASVTYLEGNLLALRSLPGLAGSQSLAELQLLFSVYHQSLSALNTAAAFAETGASLAQYVVADATLDLAPTLSLARLQAEKLYEELSLVSGALPGETPGILRQQAELYQRFRQELALARDASYTSRALLSLAPDLLGVGGHRKYLLLFQNNMEQRATGGFIGSFALLSFENGRLYDMPVYDVYQADGQLKGHVEPPGAIKSVLGEANWFMRDSNYDPDFPTSARRAEWFLKKTLNQDVDGTIAINVNTLQKLLKALGPLELADYQETVTADNVYARAETHAEVNFFPGSTAKKEYLSSVADAVFAKLRTLDGQALTKILFALSDTLVSRDTLLALQSESTNKALALLGWNGQLEARPCPGEATRCADDYLFIVDSNFGVNKANYFVDRTVADSISVTKDRDILHELTLTYTNRSSSTAWPAGAYKNYLRLYLPLGSRLTSVQIGDRELPESSVTTTSEHSRTVIGFLAEIPIKSTVPVKITYQTGVKLVSGGGVYSLYYQKQSGSSAADPLQFTLNYPLFLKPAVVSPQAEIKTQALDFTFKNDADHRLSVKFQE